MFNLEIRTALDLSASAFSGAYMVATLASAALMTWVGKGSDRWGPGRSMAAAALGLWLATLWMGQVQGLTTLVIGFFLIRFFGQGALSLASGHALAMWFERRLGIAEGVRLTAFGVGMVVLPTAIGWTIAQVGWRTAWPMMGTVAAVAVFIGVFGVHRDRPEDMGSALDGAQPGVVVGPARLEGATLGQAMRHPAFWAVVACSANSAMVATAVMFHVQPLAVAKGLDESAAAGLIGAYAAIGTSLYFVCGWVGDRVAPARIFAAAAGLIALGSLGFTTATPSWGPYVGMGAMGTASALLGTSLTPTLARCFGRAHHGAIRGLVSSVGVAASAVGPFLLGLSSDHAGGFDPGLMLFAGIGGAVAIGVSVVRIPSTPM